MNRIMNDFYHSPESQADPKSLPRVLGLSASPVMKSSHMNIRQVFLIDL